MTIANGSAQAKAAVRLDRRGLVIGTTVVPLHVGSVHYWRLDPAVWRAALESTRAMGLRLVDTYVPWGVHERADGTFDFGASDRRLDVAAFLRMAADLDLYAIVRPGPHINAELTYFGLPERVVWNPDCQARSPKQNPVLLPAPPVAFPVPSYASETFLRETDAWFRAVGPVLAPLVYPHGPIVMVQIDNEGAFYFRDGVYDQDYRPEVIARYRDMLRQRYQTVDALRAAYGRRDIGFDTVEPPARFDAESAVDLARHLDWAELKEDILAASLSRMAADLDDSGLGGVPKAHNFPLGHEATPLVAAKVRKAVDLIGIDYYYKASERSAVAIAQRTTEMVSLADGTNAPPFASEMGAGFPPFFPVLDEADNLFTAMTALAFGLRGLNLYMAVGRDRWVGAPIDADAQRGVSFDVWRRLFAALDRIGLASLYRVAPVRLVVPALERRLLRVTHAFGPITPTAFASFGAGALEGAFEDDIGLDASPVMATDRFIRSVEGALWSRGVPFARVAGDVAELSLTGASWVICASGGGIEPELFECLAAVARRGVRVTVGPRKPERDASMRPFDHRLDGVPIDWQLDGTTAGGSAGAPFAAHGGAPPGALGASEPSGALALVDAAIAALGLPILSADPKDALVTLHQDDTGAPRVLFVINPRSEPMRARVAWNGAARFSDLMDGTTANSVAGELELELAPRTVRMLAIDRL